MFVVSLVFDVGPSFGSGIVMHPNCVRITTQCWTSDAVQLFGNFVMKTWEIALADCFDGKCKYIGRKHRDYKRNERNCERTAVGVQLQQLLYDTVSNACLSCNNQPTNKKKEPWPFVANRAERIPKVTMHLRIWSIHTQFKCACPQMEMRRACVNTLVEEEVSVGTKSVIKLNVALWKVWFSL